MLQKLSIKNVALIDSANIEFCGGLNVLSGETGAGKSVILDSVNFVLGAKADRTMIRYGESECLVKAEFIVPENSRAVKVLREMDIDSDGEIIISRKFSESGKSTIKINGETVTVAITAVGYRRGHLLDHQDSKTTYRTIFNAKSCVRICVGKRIIGDAIVNKGQPHSTRLIRLLHFHFKDSRL